MTRAAVVDYASKGIYGNTVAPGLVEIPMTERWLNDPSYRQMAFGNVPMGCPAQPEEIAGMALFLCSSSAGFTTGGVFAVDGAQGTH